ncbi:hypothetical protein [Demequina salsinemoris]|uniref:hypothetical protein n=1 Tax=Demequina salsinemoris TaxID=577470 RepID=UPI000784724C|nr:hypothetical protein [Demequina salsinemoris]
MIAACGVALAILVAFYAGVTVVAVRSEGGTRVLLGSQDSYALQELAVFLGLGVLALLLCVIPGNRWWYLLLVPARVVTFGACGVAGLIWLFSLEDTAVALEVDGCDTGYVVLEKSFLMGSSGSIYERDGLVITQVAYVPGDDGYHPFAEGSYSVVERGRQLLVWYDVEPPVSTPAERMEEEPDATLPVLAGHACAG